MVFILLMSLVFPVKIFSILTRNLIVYNKIRIILLFAFLVTTAYSQSKPEIVCHYVDTTRVERDMAKITQTQNSRNYLNIETLNYVADYIKAELTKVCDSTAYQNYDVGKRTYKNVIGSIGIKNEERIIIGAHYDVYGNQPGADDNASGIAGLLELARLLAKEKLNYRLDFVAYTLEEPPFFRTEQMGSYIHAKYLQDNQIPVKGMVCLEAIGFFSNKPNSQMYPIKEMNMLYGDKGDFITIVQSGKSGAFGKEFERLMKTSNLIKTNSFIGSSALPGIDFSDHLNYWKFDYEALMITDTAFYRNKNYHTSNDRLETIDFKKMNLVIEQLYLAIKEIK
ncbi:hypothetical protein MNBD_BACTEROID03-2352 [hydrothermal vent metagenome]|uniref:Peptidase M28 domain-containing protein n=1 Tax=hydrothermal vent metagenome TaxID=652676 RepID=A0A3B0TAM4_9ZZZZ